MNSALTLIAACMLLVAANGFQFDNEASTIEAALGGVPRDQAFRHWMLKHGKEYDTTAEAEHRYTVWEKNVEVVIARNQEGAHSVKLGLNAFADLTREEFRSQFVNNQKPFEAAPKPDLRATKKGKSWRYDKVEPVNSVDWREAGVCGSCWAFATVGIAEIASNLFSGEAQAGSEQQLIDCDTKHDYGCAGGDIHNGLDYIIYNHGMTTEDTYPYIGHDDSCDVPKEKKHDVSGMHHYTGGIFDVDCCSDVLVLDHAMVILGYGEEDGEKYWILKNSWGTEWGEGGFIRMKRFVKDVGQCGLTSMPTMVTRGPFAPARGNAVGSAIFKATSGMRKVWNRVTSIFH
eukprot:gene22865-30038_t